MQYTTRNCNSSVQFIKLYNFQLKLFKCLQCNYKFDITGFFAILYLNQIYLSYRFFIEKTCIMICADWLILHSVIKTQKGEFSHHLLSSFTLISAHTNFHDPRSTPSGRKVTEPEEEEEKYWRMPRVVLANVSVHARTLNPPPRNCHRHHRRRCHHCRRRCRRKGPKNWIF